MLEKTTAQLKIAALNKRIRIVQGGTSSSKTFTIIPLLIHYAIETPQAEISIVAESIPHLKRGAIRDFIKIMHWTNNFRDSQFNKTDLKYTFSNGSYIEFFSADQPDRLRGARRDVLFINECNNIAFEAYQQLAIRTKNFIYLDYNPTSEFWVHTELKNDPDAEMIILTYKDNEALSQTIVTEIEKAREKAKTSKYWENWWNVYGLGLIGSLQGVIISDWEQIDNVPNEAKYVGSGLDFGYTTDPTTLVDVYQYNGLYIFDEIIYETQLLNKDIADRCKDLIRFDNGKEYKVKRFIYADSAEPKSIREINNFGIAMIGADKGADSIKFGLSLLQSRHLLITNRSLNLIKELRGYVWDTDKTGAQLNKPIQANDHLIDAMRYWAMMSIGRSQKVDLR